MKQQFFRTNFILIVLAGCFVLSCRQIDVYEKNTPIPNYEWQNSFVYEVSGNGFNLKSLGKNKAEGGTGPDKDIYSAGSAANEESA